jgi:shikimate kinase
MNRHGVVIFLDATPEVLFQRLWPGRSKRPLLKGLSKQELAIFIKERTAARRSYYELASVHYRVKEPNQQSAIEISGLLSSVTGH